MKKAGACKQAEIKRVGLYFSTIRKAAVLQQLPVTERKEITTYAGN